MNHHVTGSGSKGDVVALDQMLVYARYKYTDGRHVDGKFGSNTEAAVRDFQEHHNQVKGLKPGAKGHLGEDGKVGNFNGKEDAGSGTREALILEFQQKYNTLKIGTELPTDGKMSPKVFEALKNYYNNRGLRDDGAPGISKEILAAAERGALVIAAATAKRGEPAVDDVKAPAATPREPKMAARGKN